MINRKISEKQAIDEVMHKRKFDDELIKKFLNIYNLLKVNVPREVRPCCSFFYYLNSRDGDLKMKIHNYRAFLLPYENNKVQLIFPKEKILTLRKIYNEKRLRELSDFCLFTTFPCCVLYLKLDEVNKFESEHWSYFSQACRLAYKAKRTKVNDGLIYIEWNRKF